MEVLIDEFFNAFPPCKNVDHKIEAMLGLAPPLKAPYRLNQKELKKFKKQLNDLFNQRYIQQIKLPYKTLILFANKNDDKLKMCIDYHAFE